eukprot:m.27331 g.27331  ORF g.27331 m.27331 type:complete len:454 (+) comp7885_c0_seq4:34-1395(+)
MMSCIIGVMFSLSIAFYDTFYDTGCPEYFTNHSWNNFWFDWPNEVFDVCPDEFCTKYGNVCGFNESKYAGYTSEEHCNDFIMNNVVPNRYAPLVYKYNDNSLACRNNYLNLADSNGDLDLLCPLAGPSGGDLCGGIDVRNVSIAIKTYCKMYNGGCASYQNETECLEFLSGLKERGNSTDRNSSMCRIEKFWWYSMAFGTYYGQLEDEYCSSQDYDGYPYCYGDGYETTPSPRQDASGSGSSDNEDPYEEDYLKSLDCKELSRFGKTVTHTGYVSDVLCARKALNYIVTPDTGINPLLEPWNHTMFCMRDIKACYDSGLVLLDQVGAPLDIPGFGNENLYQPKYVLAGSLLEEVRTIMKSVNASTKGFVLSINIPNVSAYPKTQFTYFGYNRVKKYLSAEMLSCGTVHAGQISSSVSTSISKTTVTATSSSAADSKHILSTIVFATLVSFWLH